MNRREVFAVGLGGLAALVGCSSSAPEEPQRVKEPSYEALKPAYETIPMTQVEETPKPEVTTEFERYIVDNFPTSNNNARAVIEYFAQKHDGTLHSQTTNIRYVKPDLKLDQLVFGEGEGQNYTNEYTYHSAQGDPNTVQSILATKADESTELIGTPLEGRARALYETVTTEISKQRELKFERNYGAGLPVEK